ncbi:macrocin-O-methyltransferase family protein [Synechococcus sp. Minos11]|uniref:TylF/MycF/NovP-related O-methyltransferase n=1 Tax=Synechococcus sp. Minos11 TaxID=221341 RepID=UPI001644AB0D|nr:TylF/MycF/NovP-related O-methyltransferase [Synechococcus sp. Minos11]QNJ07686.1 macrocin-O-methyltransferase family protein [Synechococcus sp. Minos11]
MIKLSADWQFNVLGVSNYLSNSHPLRFYFNFIKEQSHKFDGDIVESGVFQGHSLIATAQILKSINSTKTVYGYDTFCGFPPVYNLKDDPKYFHDLFKDEQITSKHLSDVTTNLRWRELLSESTLNASTISSSGNFSATSRSCIERKLSILGLDNVVLVEGSFKDTMAASQHSGPSNVCAALVDCDLYDSHIATFEFLWPKLEPNALIYLDEYYSLKFPGARAATNEFLATISSSDSELVQFPTPPSEFERWGLIRK